uniref:Terpene synthase 6 n=1 Tax=Santalum album TaxID=35974 RepID=A0A678Y0J8_SANAL|nr:terpene synthase 6 [Santalum album]
MESFVFLKSATSNANNSVKVDNRRSANYQSSVWDYNFLRLLGTTYTCCDTMEEEHVRIAEKLKEEVKSLIMGSMGPLANLEFIDAVQRLGLKYQFETEIKEALFAIYKDSNEEWWANDLHATALRFRLLRRNLLFVSQDVFERFKDKKTHDFSGELCEDVKGILSLYEACFLGWDGERVLDKARIFTTTHLNAMNRSTVSDGGSLDKKVKHALELPLHWRAPRVEARWFIDVYEQDPNMNLALLKLAKLDFNMVQSIHQKEVGELSRWWVRTGLDKLSFARNGLMQNYMYCCAVTFEPQFAHVREALTKIGSVLTATDDLYDVYGSLEELELFTSFIDRWDIKEIDELPRDIRLIFLAMYNLSNEIGFDILRDRDFNGVPYVAKMLGDVCSAYLKEARWYHGGYKPRMEEYLDNGLVSIGMLPLLAVAYMLTTDNLSKETVDHVAAAAPLVRYCSLLLRMIDDLGTSSDELRRGDTLKSVECYMNQAGASEEIAREHIEELVRNTWKKMNQCCFGDGQSSFADPFLSFTLNSVRGAHFFYQFGDGFGVTESWTKDTVLSVLFQPIPLDED